MNFLVWAMVIDYVTGVAAAWKLKSINSDVMLVGGFRKVMVLLLVALCYQLDQWLGNGEPLFRTACIWFYAIREALSVLENYGKMGLPTPQILKDRLEQIAEQQNKPNE
jgi:toxin secretion/phage lysis holin